MKSYHGLPCWYELATSDPDAAQGFYAGVFGWTWASAGMEGFDYRLASAGTTRVAGMMAMQPQVPMPCWTGYIAVDDCDKTAAQATKAGAQTYVPPTDIPNTGRFAVLADPQGAVMGILQPLPMEVPPESGAYNPHKPGHGAWLELTSSDPKAGAAYYDALFGWRESRAMDMGAMGTYRIFARDGQDLGGMMGLGSAPQSCWMIYFAVAGVDTAITAITKGGGTVHRGPQEVPGGAFIVTANDPQGAWFSVVGPRG